MCIRDSYHIANGGVQVTRPMKHEIIPVSPELLALIGTEGINALGLPKREIFLLDIVVAGTTFCPVVQELYPCLLYTSRCG